MRILFVCHRFPFPPKRGGKIRPFNMIRHLSASGHEVTVASLARSRDEASEGQGISSYCARFEMAHHRLMDPILDLHGRAVGEAARRIDGALQLHAVAQELA